MRDRCPRCGYVFAREEGFFLGALLVNLAITEALLAVVGIIPLIVLLAANPDANVMPVIGGGLLAVTLGPVVFYPFSRSCGCLWSSSSAPSLPGAERPRLTGGAPTLIRWHST